MDMASVFAPITKSYEQEDGSLLVEGIVSDASLDLDQQRCDPNWLKKAVPQWFSVGNLREQHDEKRAIGKAIEHQDLGDGGHFIRGRVVDPVAVAKAKAGVFTGFSIGIKQPRISKSADAPGGLITDGRICEVSLVDFPCNSNATLTVCKAAAPGMELNGADFDEERGLVRCEELVEKAAEAELEKAAEPELAKDDSVAHADAHISTAGEVEAARNPGDSPNEGQPGCGCCGECMYTAPFDKAAEPAATKAFDKEAAGKFVKAVLAKADGGDDGDDMDMSDVLPPEYDEEQSDIERAQSAIACISQLIISEAQEMCDNPAEDCDIELLMQAVAALRCFICREQEQAMGADVVKKPVPVLPLAAEAELEKAKYSAEELRQMLKDGKAIANANGDPSYPIGDKEDLANAIRAVGRGSGDHDKIRAYIIRRAKALGCMDMIPDSWTASGDNDKAANVEVTMDGTAEFAEKAAEPEATKAAVVESDPEALVKALTAALEKADNPLRKSFEAMIEAATEDTAESVKALTERLSKVEAMATPGGPALRRTETERKEARKADLLTEAARYRALAQGAEDLDLRKGYAAKAGQLEAEIRALVA